MITHNVFESFLKFMNVKYTNSYSDSYYDNHPYKYSLYGLSKMLSDYKVENVSIRLKNKRQGLGMLDVPFIAHFGNDFVVVYGKDCGSVSYQWGSKFVRVDIERFLTTWSGVALVAETTNVSGEPDFLVHHRRDMLVMWQKGVTIICLLIVLGYVVLNYAHDVIGVLLLLFINMIGFAASILLLLKQLKIRNGYIDNVCSLLLPRGDCNNILYDKAAKLWDWISWSEVGVGYFMANIFICFFMQNLLPIASIFNMASIPYTLWSVGYQRFVKKQWCSLCLLVQGVLWLLFVVNLFTFGAVKFVDYSLPVICGSVYLSFVLLVNLLSSFVSKMKYGKKLLYDYNSLKLNEDVFNVLLKANQQYDVSSFSNILWGNRMAENVITVVTNPYCNPCAQVHKKLSGLLNKYDVAIQYVFTSFSEELEFSCLFLIAVYQNGGLEDFEKTQSDWFSFGKMIPARFCEKYTIEIETNFVREEYERHKEMLKKLNIISTPTVLFNGWLLNSFYSIDDLAYFLPEKTIINSKY